MSGETRVHISSLNLGEDTNAQYATKKAGAWTTEIVDDTRNVGLYSSIDVDLDSNPFIAYHDAEDRTEDRELDVMDLEEEPGDPAAQADDPSRSGSP